MRLQSSSSTSPNRSLASVDRCRGRGRRVRAPSPLFLCVQAPFYPVRLPLLSPPTPRTIAKHWQTRQHRCLHRSIDAAAAAAVCAPPLHSFSVCKPPSPQFDSLCSAPQPRERSPNIGKRDNIDRPRHQSLLWRARVCRASPPLPSSSLLGLSRLPPSPPPCKLASRRRATTGRALRRPHSKREGSKRVMMKIWIRACERKASGTVPYGDGLTRQTRSL